MPKKKILPITIKVQKQDPTDEGWQFVVWLGDEEARTEHIVTLDREYWDRLTKSVGTPADIIKKSFEFLLKKEPQEAILKSFDLRVIRRHFPDFEKEIIPEEPYLEARPALSYKGKKKHK
ncbi:MAG: hypothetical protein Q8L47_00680 [bacterium]|nr:hypothetical protein [bacterium]